MCTRARHAAAASPLPRAGCCWRASGAASARPLHRTATPQERTRQPAPLDTGLDMRADDTRRRTELLERWAPEFGGRNNRFQRFEIGRVRTGCLVLVENVQYLRTPFQ